MLPAGITEAQVSAWKKKHRKIFIISVETDEEVKKGFKEAHAIFKQPDMDIMSAMTKKLKADEIQGANFLYKSCLLASDPEIDEDISLKMSVIGELKGLVEKKKSKLKKAIVLSAISDKDNEDDILKGNALIRFYFKENPKGLSVDDWGERVQEALWLKRFELKNLAELISAMFGKKED